MPNNGNGANSAPGTASRRPVEGRRRGTGPQRPARGGGGGNKLLFLMLVLIAGGAGAGLAFKDKILGPAAPIVPPAKPPGKLPEKPPEKPPEYPDNDRAARTVSDVERLLADMKYDPAVRTIQGVGLLKCRPELSGRVAKLAAKAEAFLKLSSEVKVRADAGKELQVAVLADGRRLKGVVTPTGDGGYSVLVGTAGGGQMTYTFAGGEVAKVEQVDPAERLSAVRREIDARLSRLGADPTPPDVIDVAVYAFENAMNAEGHRLLEQAWSAAGKSGGNLLRLVSEHRAGRLFAIADWYDSVAQESFARSYCDKILKSPDYGQTGWADSARKLLAMMDERKGLKNYEKTYTIEAPKVAVKPPDETSSSPAPTEPSQTRPAPKVTAKSISAKGTDLTEANRLFTEGLTSYSKGMSARGTPEGRPHLIQAAKCFRRAGEIYENALKAEPGNAALESRAVDCNKFRYACMKHTTL